MEEKTRSESTDKVELMCRRIIGERGWLPFNDINVTEYEREKSQPVMQAAIRMDNRQIQIQVAKEIMPTLEKMIFTHDLQITPGLLLDNMTKFAMVHEHGHHIFCPRRDDFFKSILEGCADAIKGRETSSEKIVSMCFQLHNMFSDTVLNTINSHSDREKDEYRLGLNLFYQQLGFLKQEGSKLMPDFMPKFHKRKLDKAMTLFINSNHILCGIDEANASKVSQYYPKLFLESARHSKKLVDIFTGDPALTQAVYNQDFSGSAGSDLLDRLKEYSLWKQMAFEYTKIIYPYMRDEYKALESSFTKKYDDAKDQKKKSSQSAGGNGPQNSDPGKGSPQNAQGNQPPQDKKGNTGQKDKGQGQGQTPANPKEDKKGSSDSGKEDKNQSINPTPGDMTTAKQSRAEKRASNSMMKDLIKQLLEGKIADPQVDSDFLKHYDRLDELYQSRAGRIRLMAEDANNELSYDHKFGSTELPLSEFELRDIDWSSTRILGRNDGTQDIQFYKRDMPLTLDLRTSQSASGILDLSFIFDSSGSMHFEPFCGEGKGDYHFAVLTFYSILKDLQERGLAPLINYNVINYASFTRDSGWQPYSQLEKVKRSMLDYQKGTTILDPLALKKLRTTRKDNFISFMLTDGGFVEPENEAAVVCEIEEIKKIGNIGFYLFQMGGRSSFSEKLESMQIPVHYISSAQDFMENTIKFTSDLYGRLIQNGAKL
jgi:hypothetical protein